MERIPGTNSCIERSASIPTARIRRFAWTLVIVWTLLLSVFFSWYYHHQREETEAVARAEARAAIGRDMLYRRWASFHGGVYVPVTEQTPPNPYLSHVVERDITTPSGRALTLINPAYMTRQVYELSRKEESVGLGHLSSLNPLRPENTPDPWESKALQAFEKGVTEVLEVQNLNGTPHMRLMRPFVTDAPCLKCHANQGYQDGDIRGGISVSIPMQSFEAIAREEVTVVAAAHGVLWFAGIGLIGFGARNLARSSRIIEENEQRYRTVADFTSDWEFWVLEDGTFRYISPSCEEISGYSPDEFYADPHLMQQIIHPDDLPLYVGHTHRLTAQHVPEPLDYRIYSKKGECRWISHVCRTIYDVDGQSLGQRASNRDITDRKNAEEEVRQQSIMLEKEVAERQQAQETLQEQAALLEEEIAERQVAQEHLAVKQLQLEMLNQSLEIRINESVAEMRQKDKMLIQQGRLAAMGEMIHNIAHQWRQPLNNIGLIIQNLQISFATNSLTPEEMDKEVDNAMVIIMHMSRTIDDFRNFFRPEKERHSFVINAVVDHALEFVGATLANNNIRVDLYSDGDVSVNGYQNEYAQVLLNIIGNARDVLVERNIAQPNIVITITRENKHSIVTICDNGGGIAEDIMPKIFDPYFTTKEQGKGTGIGLYMSKAIIEQNMYGSLTVHNVAGGAEFRIEV